MTRTARRLAVVLGLAGVALTACGGTGTGDHAAERTGPADGTLTSIANAMAAQGHDAEAGMARSSGARLTAVPAPFGRNWRVYEVDGNGPHAVQYSVCMSPRQVILMTGHGPAFGPMARAAGARADTPAQAVTLARLYLRVTRPTDVLSYTVSGVGQIRFRPNLAGADAARRDAIVRKYRGTVTAPRAVPDSGGFTVTAYTVRDRTLERRTLGIGRTGAVRDHATTLADDLPVPYTL